VNDAAFPSTGYLAWQFSQIIARQLERGLRAENLTLAQHNALQHVVRSPGISTADIARRSNITAQSMGTAVSQLIERGLLRREPHPTSRRSRQLFVTDVGQAAAARAASTAHRLESETISLLSGEDKATLNRLLYHLVQELNPDALSSHSR
jgi:DNA-binding MarR family transcriptional regulator